MSWIRIEIKGRVHLFKPKEARDLLGRLALMTGTRLAEHEREPLAETTTALKSCVDALESVWAAIGDALCSGKGIVPEYANAVAKQARDASEAGRAALARKIAS